jgi:peroxiredoxin
MSDAPQPPAQRPSPLERPLVRGAIAVVLLALLGGGAFLLQNTRGSSSAASNVTPVSVQATQDDAGLGAIDRQAPVIGQPAPDFVLRDVNGKTMKLSDLRGKVVYVNFWATWCVPCKQELPDIQTLYNEKHAQGLEVLEVNWQEPADLAKSYFSQRKLPMPLLLDPNSSVYNQYKLQGLPDSFFVDRSGNISSFYYGQLSLTKMRERVAQAGLP